MKAKKAFFFSVICCLLIFLTGCLGEGEDKTIKMNAQEFAEYMYNSTRSVDNTSHHIYYNITLLNPGDIVIVEDEIFSISYNRTQQATTLYFSSDYNHPLPFEGDLTDRFAKNDKVRIKFHITRDDFTHPENTTWTISVETVKEGWNMTSHTSSLPFPSTIIKKI